MSGKYIEFPDWSPDCATDPAYGPNPDVTDDCGWPRAQDLLIGAFAGMKYLYPAARAILGKADFTQHDIGVMALYYDVQQLTPQAGALRWLADNCARWTAWSDVSLERCPTCDDAGCQCTTDACTETLENINGWDNQDFGVLR